MASISSSTSAATSSISGLATGLNTDDIITKLMALERQQQTLTRNRARSKQSVVDAYAQIASKVNTLQTASAALARATSWNALRASSSNESVVSVTGGNASVTGSLSFTVDALATAGAVRSTNTVASTATPIAADTAVLLARGANALGLSGLASDDTLALGVHTIAVTQASQAATKQGTGPVGGSTTITAGVNDTINATVNGAPTVITIAAGTYDADGLAAAITAAAGGTLTATSNGGTLSLSTAREGSNATLLVTGGTALGTLNLTVDGAAHVGVDGVVTVDGTATTLTSIDPGATATLNAPVGTVTARFAGGVRVGSIDANNVATGDGSLATVVNNINGANAGIVAAAVQVGVGQYRLQLTATTTGANSAVSTDASEFTGLGGLTTISAGTDAQITVGSGPGAYSITNASNTLTNVLPGLSMTLKALSATPVTATLSSDPDAIAQKITDLVTAANDALGTINDLTAYDPDTKTGSVLTGDSTARAVKQAIFAALTGPVASSTLSSAGLAGVSIDRNGTASFDKAKFLTAYTADPNAVRSLFVQQATATSSEVAFVSAGNRAAAGTYAVAITQAATQATNTGLAGAWPKGAPPTVQVKWGGVTASYALTGADTQATTVAALNALFAQKNFALTASISGAGVAITSNDYGSVASFDVDWGSGFSTYTGVDVAGTIDGRAATGAGQLLTMAATDATIPGLSLRISATAPGALGTVTYDPGVAQRITTVSAQATDSVNGTITTASKGVQTVIDALNASADSMETALVAREATLRAQFTAMETAIAALQQQSSWLASQLNSLGST